MTISLRRRIFNHVLLNHLVYNQCWEDYVLDQSALQIATGDRIVVITSAGCNVLNYLLFDPARIDAVDMNPHQSALLELKLAAIQQLEYEDFFAMFGFGRIRNHRQVYAAQLRPLLTSSARNVWDRSIH